MPGRPRSWSATTPRPSPPLLPAATPASPPFSRLRRRRLVDPFLAKVEELVDHSQAKIRADVVHQRLVAMGFGGVERPRSPQHPPTSLVPWLASLAGQDLGGQE